MPRCGSRWAADDDVTVRVSASTPESDTSLDRRGAGDREHHHPTDGTHTTPQVSASAERSSTRSCARRGGNPLALVELPPVWHAYDASVSAATPPLTARLERAFAGRLSELPQETRDAVLVAAVDSLDDLAEILAATSVLGSTEAKVDALGPAALAGLVQLEDRHVRFRHPLVRSAVLQSEALARRHAAHTALAQVLTDDLYRGTWHRAHLLMAPDENVADDLQDCHRTALQRGSVSHRRSGRWKAPPSSQRTRRAVPTACCLRLSTRSVSAAATSRPTPSRRVTTLALRPRPGACRGWLREIFDDGVPGDAGPRPRAVRNRQAVGPRR